MVRATNPEEKPVRQAAALSEPSPDQELDLSAVYRDHASRVYRAAYRVTGNAQDAEDVLQTVFTRLVRRGSDTQLTGDPGPYLSRAAINAGLDVVRSRRTNSESSDELTLGSLPSTRPGPASEQEGHELRDRVRQALGGVSPRAAEIFALRYFEGYDNHEIARMVGTSRSTVGVILHRTRQSVREQLENNEKVGGD